MAKEKFESVEEFCVKPSFDRDGVQSRSGIGRDGKEYPDPVPMEPPIGFNAPPDLMSIIRQMVHHEQFKVIADREGFDTFEEAGDFDVDDDIPDPLTPHELLFFPPDEKPKEEVKVEGAKPTGSPDKPAAPAPEPTKSDSTST